MKTVLLIIFLHVMVLASENEDTLKGVFLERVSHFIKYQDDKQDFNVCVYDDKAFFSALNKLYVDRKISTKKVSVIELDDIYDSSTSECDILYAKNFRDVNSLVLKNTLLVTDSLGFLNDGYMLALYFKEAKIKFAINQKAVHLSNIKMNYRLLKSASKIINPLK